MSNMFFLKRKLRPELYEHGEVRVFTKEEIRQWEEHNQDLVERAERQRNESENDTKFLDSLKLQQHEEIFREQLEGVNDRDNDSNEG